MKWGLIKIWELRRFRVDERSILPIWEETITEINLSELFLGCRTEGFKTFSPWQIWPEDLKGLGSHKQLHGLRKLGS